MEGWEQRHRLLHHEQKTRLRAVKMHSQKHMFPTNRQMGPRVRHTGPAIFSCSVSRFSKPLRTRFTQLESMVVKKKKTYWQIHYKDYGAPCRGNHLLGHGCISTEQLSAQPWLNNPCKVIRRRLCQWAQCDRDSSAPLSSTYTIIGYKLGSRIKCKKNS